MKGEGVRVTEMKKTRRDRKGIEKGGGKGIEIFKKGREIDEKGLRKETK